MRILPKDTRLSRVIRRHWILSTLGLAMEDVTANKKIFWLMMAFMCLQNMIFFGLWIAVFAQIGTLRGWGLREVAFITATGAIGVGLGSFFAGGLNRLSETIQNNGLDVYLSRPRSVLISALFYRCRPESLGDVVYGIIILALFVHPSLHTVPLVAALTFSIGIVFFSLRLVLHSLAFWGMSETAAEGSFMSVLIAGSNPLKGFGFWGKVFLFSVFPAGYLALLPVEIFLEFRWDFLLWQLGASLSLLSLAIATFYLGLRRYESGNGAIILR